MKNNSPLRPKGTEPEPAPSPPPASKYNIWIFGSKGIVIGDNNEVEQNFFGSKSFIISIILLLFISLMVITTITQLIWDPFGYIKVMRRPGGVLNFIWPPEPMPDGFNIAVAEFSVSSEAAANPDTEGVGWRVGDWLTRGIKDEKVLYPDILPTVWGPDEFGIIPGEDDDSRAANAADFAAQYHINILIYGVITGSHKSYFVEPKFYVAGQSFVVTQSFEYGSEVIGPDQLGQPVQIQLPFEDPDQYNLNNELKARRRVLHHVIYGLGYFYFNNYTEAFEEFDDASSEKLDVDLAVVHLLKSAAKMREYNDASLSREVRLEAFLTAEKALSDTLELNPVYARGYLSLAGIAFQRATALNPQWPTSIDQAKLKEAEDDYLKSLQLSDPFDSAYVHIKGNYGLGQIYLTGYHYFPCNWSGKQAQTYFNKIITTYKEPPPAILWFVGKAHTGLAWLAMLAGDQQRGAMVLSQCPQNIAFPEKQWAQTVVSECEQAIDLLKQIKFNRPDDAIADCQSWSNAALQ